MPRKRKTPLEHETRSVQQRVDGPITRQTVALSPDTAARMARRQERELVAQEQRRLAAEKLSEQRQLADARRQQFSDYLGFEVRDGADGWQYAPKMQNITPDASRKTVSLYPGAGMHATVSGANRIQLPGRFHVSNSRNQYGNVLRQRYGFAPDGGLQRIGLRREHPRHVQRGQSRTAEDVFVPDDLQRRRQSDMNMIAQHFLGRVAVQRQLARSQQEATIADGTQ